MKTITAYKTLKGNYYHSTCYFKATKTYDDLALHGPIDYVYSIKSPKHETENKKCLVCGKPLFKKENTNE